MLYILFKRLFNWLKLKTLPSSVLFKNRLFIERDSKHRRIMSSWGLTFRNSKWTNYSLSNVSVRSITSFLNLLISILFAAILIILLKSQFNFYSVELTYNVIMYFYWSIKAQTSHIIFISFWGIHYLFNSVFNFIFYKYLDKMFNISLKTPETQTLLNSTKNTIDNYNQNDLLKSTVKSVNNISTKDLEEVQNLFENQDEHNINTVLLLKDLYKIVYLLSLQKNSYVNFSVFSNNKSIDNDTITRTSYIKPEAKWSLDTLDRKNPLAKTGLFYITDLNYNSLNNNSSNLITSTLNFDLQNQINMVGIQRFMFKYNPLHRSIMKGSITLTNTKKLLAPYNMSSSLSLKKTNLWLSQKNKHYDNFNKNATIKVSNSIENSYLFTLKRYYMFNKLSANLITSKFDYKINQSNVNLNIISKNYENWSLFYSNILNTLITKSSLNKFNILLNNNSSINHFFKSDLTNLSNKFDTIINLEDHNLFNNNNDILLNYFDSIVSLKTQLNTFNVYSSDEFYLNMMYDFNNFNDNNI